MTTTSADGPAGSSATLACESGRDVDRRGGEDSGRPSQRPALRVALWLSALVSLLMLVASAAGLLLDGVYRDPASVSSIMRGYDLVTVVVVVPALAVTLLAVRRRSPLAQLAWVGLLAAAVYTYAFYVFGLALNALFLVHVAVFSGSIFALVFALVSIDADAVADRLTARTPSRLIAAILALLALGLGGMWIIASLRFAVTGEIPAGSALVETDTIVHLGIALDLSLLVPLYAAGAVLLWRHAPWGYLIAAVVLVSGVVHQLGYLVAMPFQAAAVPGAPALDPAEPVIAGLFVVTAALLLRPLVHAAPRSRARGATRREASSARHL